MSNKIKKISDSKKYGFVYIWYDKRDKRYYVGCHWGHEDDGYICSSTWMRNTYRRRPHDFKRRILKRIYTTRQDLFAEEQRYLSMIKPEEVRVRYFNLHVTVGHWSAGDNVLTIKEKISKSQIGKKLTEEHKQNIGNSIRGKKIQPWSDERKLAKSIEKAGKPRSGDPANWSFTHSDETKKKMSESHKGKNSGKKFYNNGIETKLLYECPVGWKPGMITHK